MPIPENPLKEIPKSDRFYLANAWPINVLADWLGIDRLSQEWRDHVSAKIAAMIRYGHPEDFLSPLASGHNAMGICQVDGRIYVSTDIAYELAAGLPTANSARFMAYQSVMARVMELRDAGASEDAIEIAVENLLKP